MKKLILALVGLAVVAIIIVFAVTASSWPKAGGDKVDLSFFSFHPGTLTVSVGTTVTWTDEDWIVKHNIIGDGFGSDNLSHGGTYSYTFTKAGTYGYRCSHHPWMRGKIIVQ